MNIEALKEKARRHEQKDEWQKALDLYRDALRKQDEDEPPDINLFNRVGDIQTRLGKVDGAVESYEKAIELYLEAELPNNAIAICKKVLRNLPDRRVFFLRMGQIRGTQGFLTDARQNFLTFAEMATEAGEIDEALDGLIELVELAPEDLEIRMGLASQLEAQGREEEAIPQYVEGYRRMVLHDMEDEAQALVGKIKELAPDTMLPDPQSIRAGAAQRDREVDLEVRSDGLLAGLELGSGIPVDEAPTAEVEVEFGEIEIDGGEQVEEPMAEEGEAAPVAEATDAMVETPGFELPTEGILDAPEGEAPVEAPVEEMSASGLEGDGMVVGGEDEGEELPTFGFEDDEEAEDEAEPLPTLGFEDDEEAEDEAEPLPTFGFEDDEEAEDDAEPLPTLGFEDDEGAEEEAEPLPTSGFEDDEGAEDEGEPAEAHEPEAPELGAADFGVADLGDRETKEYVDEGEDLPELDVDLDDLAPEDEATASEGRLEEALEDAAFESAVDEDVAAPSPEVMPAEPVEETPSAPEPTSHEEAAQQGKLDLAMEMLRSEIAFRPDQVDLYQRMVEYAFRKADRAVLISAYMELAEVLARSNAPLKAKAIYQQVLSLSPSHEGATEGLAALDGTSTKKVPSQVASSEEYVDLGSMILGEGGEKTTRWQVTADAPSGDDQADFAKMLSQFKQKVSEHVDADDVSAHHDLGTAYLEMGLLDEAVSEFQMALRASPDHLPTHEVMGRCWMEMNKPSMAVRALTRALESPFEVEDELIGIYYLMGRAQEDLGNGTEAMEFYDKVFSLDINFEDVTERLRALRED